ncbi:hypothetical protein ACFVYV_39605 [Streptomyces mirabilis]|uniref:hypothetical protein n=1 Tax=Streptomyces mirabilis TaxID=68239 RepID=UPI0036DB1225
MGTSHPTAAEAEPEAMAWTSASSRRDGPTCPRSVAISRRSAAPYGSPPGAEAPALTAASADVLRAGLAARAAALHRAALAAGCAGVPPQVIAGDSRLTEGTVRRWIAADGGRR